jgi:hypothetical protein
MTSLETAKKLQTLKTKIRRKYLGEAGIHAIGVRRSQQTLCLYVESEENPELQVLIKRIEEEISPYHVLAIEEEQARITR